MKYEEVFCLKNLYDAWRKCEIGVSWKESVQRYHCRISSEIRKTHSDLMKKKVRTGYFHRFTIMERGKVRHIQSVHIRERIIQRCLCDNCLVPLIAPRLIYDNAACIKGKGMHFAVRRLKEKLHEYYIKYGTNEGYVLQFDFHHYFDTIPHDKLIKMVGELIKDDDLRNIYAKLVNDFDGDVGIGLGSQISQISALYYPHEIDNRFYNDPNIFGYARYMDDGYILSNSKEQLKECLSILRNIVYDLRLELNEKKTQIRKFGTNAFEFLKCRFLMLPNGKILVKPNKRNLTRNRRKLKKLKEMSERGEISVESVKATYLTIRGNLNHFNAKKAQDNYDELFKELFPEEARNLKKKPHRGR